MAEGNDAGPVSKTIKGLRLPGGFPDEPFLSALEYKPRDDDVFLVTYPKCGTTWTQHILVLIFRQGEPLLGLDKFFSVTPFLEMSGAEGAEVMKRPGAIKCHLPFHLTPWSDSAKYIYVTRNPKDCCVSYYHHMKGIPDIHGFRGNFDDFFEDFLSGDIDYGDYFDNLMGWYEHRNDPNVLFVTYEEMKQDPKAAVLKMASFLDDEKYAEPLRKNPEMLENVVKYSSFDYMKETVNKSMDQMHAMTKEEVLKSELPDRMKKLFCEMQDKGKHGREQKNPPPSSNFVRKGIVGDWRNHFSEEQSRRLDEKLVQRTEGTEIANWWKDCMKL